MKWIGHGIDVVSISRFREAIHRQGEKFIQRIFTPVEIEYCKQKKDPVPSFAARFAAKEAFAKALGKGLAASGELNEIGVVHEESGQPKMQFSGRALQTFQALPNSPSVLLTLSHDGDTAIASVIVVTS